MEKKNLREIWKGIFKSKGWSNQEVAKKINRHRSNVTRIINGEIVEIECIERVLDVVIKEDPHRPAEFPLEKYKRFKDHYGVTKSQSKNAEWDEKYPPEFVEKRPEVPKELLSYEEATERIEQYIKKTKSDPDLRDLLSKEEWARRKEYLQTHLILPFESLKCREQPSSEDDQNEKTKP